MIMRRFFLDSKSLRSKSPAITGSDVRHIRTVLRLKPGDEIHLFDGKGIEYRAQITGSTPQKISLSVLDRYRSNSESSVEITCGQAFLKARKMDGIVRQLTELGAFSFIPFLAERSVSRPEPRRMAEKVKRWEMIAQEAIKQCGRTQTPHIAPVASFKDLVRSHADYDLKVICHDYMHGHASHRLLPQSTRAVRRMLALIGPEGGFTEEEVKLAIESKFVCFSLGPRTLKSDTATVAAVAILQHTFGDLGGTEKCLDNK